MKKATMRQIIYKDKEGFYFAKWEQVGACNQWGEGHTKMNIEEKVCGKVIPLGVSQVRVPVPSSSVVAHPSWYTYIKNYLTHISQVAPTNAQAFRELKMINEETEPDWEDEARVVARTYAIRYYKVA